MPWKTWNVEVTFSDGSKATAEILGPHASIKEVEAHLKETRTGIRSVAEIKETKAE